MQCEETFTIHCHIRIQGAANSVQCQHQVLIKSEQQVRFNSSDNKIKFKGKPFAFRMMSIHRCFTSTFNSPLCRKNILSITKLSNFCTEKVEKVEELKLSYLTGARQGIAVVELNREIGKNSLNKSLVSKLNHSVDVLGHDKNVRVVIIR